MRLLILDRHLDRLEMSIHGDVNASHGPVDLSPIFKLDGDGLVAQLHQKLNELHLLRGRM